MNIQNTTYKMIWFEIHERHKVTRHVERLLDSGWDFNCGYMENGLVYGDANNDLPGWEEVQLHKDHTANPMFDKMIREIDIIPGHGITK